MKVVETERKIFRPYFAKDYVRRRVIGLVLVTLIVPLVFTSVYVYTNYVEKASVPPGATSALIWIAFGSELIVVAPILYAIFAILRSKIVLTEDKIIVINGFKKKVAPVKQIKEISYRVFSKGVSTYGASRVMPYEAGVIFCKRGAIQYEMELPAGWHYLQDLVRELKSRLGEGLVVDEESFQRWQKWYGTPFLKKTLQVLLVIIVLTLYLAPPVLAVFWAKENLDLKLSDFQIWLAGGLGIVAYTWILLLLLKSVDFLKNLVNKR